MASETGAWQLTLLPARAVRLFVGSWALAWDELAAAVRSPADAVERFQLRGVRVHRQFWRMMQKAERQAVDDISRLSDGALLPVRMLQAGVTDSSQYAEDEVERQVQAMLARLGIPSRDRIERLSHDIEALSARIDDELLRQERV